jgi:hypothetical protein
VTALGMMVFVATFVLGFHRLADILAGVAVGLVGVAIAWGVTDSSARLELAQESEYAIVRKRPRPVRRLAEAGMHF